MRPDSFIMEIRDFGSLAPLHFRRQAETFFFGELHSRLRCNKVQRGEACCVENCYLIV